MVPRKQTGLLECLGTRVLDLLPTNLRFFFMLAGEMTPELMLEMEFSPTKKGGKK
jgi:hypothetical protein